MKILRIAMLVLLLVFCSNVAIAGERPSRFEKPEDAVAWLYRDFGWEAFIWEYFDKDILIDQPTKVLKRYFTPRLAILIEKDRKYTIRTKELGHINFVIIYGSQDPDGISNIRINRKAGTNAVSVMYDYNGVKDVMEMNYKTVNTPNGWKISDIQYKSRESDAFPNQGIGFSLLELLSQKY